MPGDGRRITGGEVPASGHAKRIRLVRMDEEKQEKKIPRRHGHAASRETEMRQLLIPIIDSRFYTKSPQPEVYLDSGSVPRGIEWDKLTMSTLGETILPSKMVTSRTAQKSARSLRPKLVKLLDENWSANDRNCSEYRDFLGVVLSALKVTEEQGEKIRQHFETVCTSKKAEAMSL
jgi:hypothetical protein